MELILVSLVVVAAVIYVVWKYLPGNMECSQDCDQGRRCNCGQKSQTNEIKFYKKVDKS